MTDTIPENNQGAGKKIPHILILEDDTSHRELALRAFEIDPEKFRLSLAGSIRDARELLGRDPPDLIIADWLLPDGKGIDILPRDEGMVTIPLIIMTSHGDERLAVRIMKSGAIDYVIKSATMFAELPHIARRALRDWNNIRERVRAEEADRDSQKRLMDIISFLPDAVLAIDNEGRVIAWNKAIEEMTGVAAKEMLGKDDHEYSIPFYGIRRPILIDIVLTEDAETQKKYDYIQRDGEMITSETFIPTLYSGKGAYLWGTASPLYNAAGKRIGAIEVIRDITDRKRAEESIREQKATLEALLNAPHDTIALLDRQRTVIGINEEGAKRLGSTAQELTGRLVYDLLPPEVARERKTYIDRVFETGEPARLDDVRSGMYLHNEIFPIFNPGRTAVDRVAVFARDITDQKKAEQALLESETRFKDLFDNMSSGVVIYDVVGNGDDFIFKDLNRAAEKIDHVRKSEIIGKSILGVFPGVKEFGLFDVLLRVAKTGIAESYPVSEYRDNRIAGWRENFVYKLPSGEVVAVYEDMTEKKRAEVAIRESEDRYRTLAEASPDQIFIVDRNNTMKYVNAAALKLFRLPYDQVIGAPRKNLFPPDIADAQDILLQKVFETGEPVQTEERIQFGTQELWIDTRMVPLKDETGNVNAVLGIARDITEHKRAEAAIRESETRFRALIQNSSDIIRILDQDGQVVYESASAEKILGYPAGYIIGRDSMEYIHPDDLEHVKSDLREVFDKTNSGTPTEFRIRKADGEYLWVDSIGTNLLDVPGVNGIVVTTRPIQQRKMADEALSDEVTRRRILINQSRDGIVVLDENGGVFEANKRFAEMLGYSPEEVRQLHVWDWDTQWSREQLMEMVRTVDDAGDNFETRHRRKDGTMFSVEISTNGTVFSGKKFIFCVCHDITDRKLMESEIRSLNTVLEQRIKDRTEALLKANEALEEENAQRLEAEGKLRASYDEKVLLLKEIHHRVKNNLQIIASLLNLQSRYITDEKTLAAIRESQNRVKAMALVHEKLYRSADIAHVSLNDYIRFLGTGLFQFYDAKSRGIRFTLEIHDINVDIDAAIPLGLIINELISNSLKYAFPDRRTGEIVISVKKEGHTITVLFRDDGIGMPADLDWRNAPSLGLRLVTTLVDQMNGTVEIDRSSGTLFTMVLHEKEARDPS